MSIVHIEIGGNTYAAYASVDAADAYLLVDPVRGIIWEALAEDRRGAALVAASRRLDMLTFPGRPTEADQERKWPRIGVSYADGRPVSGTVVPKEVEEATILLAGTIAAKPGAAGAGGSGANFKRLKAGSAEVEYFTSTKGKPLADEAAWDILQNAGLIGGSSFGSALAAGGNMASGTDQRSAFDEGFGLNRGFN